MSFEKDDLVMVTDYDSLNGEMGRVIRADDKWVEFTLLTGGYCSLRPSEVTRVNNKELWA